MDPMTLILTALVTGAAKVAGDAAPDAYKGLKALIQKRFENKPVAQAMLEEHEKDPETYDAPLKKNLEEAGVDKDEAVLKAAQDLMKALDPQGTEAGKYSPVNVTGDVYGVAGTNTGTVTQTFNNNK